MAKIVFKPGMKVLRDGKLGTINKVEAKHLTITMEDGDKIRVYKREAALPPVDPNAKPERLPPSQVLAAARATGRYVGYANNEKEGVDNADKVAVKFRTMALDDIYKYVADEIGEDVEWLKDRYGKLNLGMQRMNLGNKLRSHLGMNDEANEKRWAKSRKKNERAKKMAVKTDEELEKEQNDE